MKGMSYGHKGKGSHKGSSGDSRVKGSTSKQVTAGRGVIKTPFKDAIKRDVRRGGRR